MKKLLIINKKINFLEKKKILYYSRIKEVIILDINYDINKDIYKNSKILSIINYSFFFRKKFSKDKSII